MESFDTCLTSRRVNILGHHSQLSTTKHPFCSLEILSRELDQIASHGRPIRLQAYNIGEKWTLIAPDVGARTSMPLRPNRTNGTRYRLMPFSLRIFCPIPIELSAISIHAFDWWRQPISATAALASWASGEQFVAIGNKRDLTASSSSERER